LNLTTALTALAGFAVSTFKFARDNKRKALVVALAAKEAWDLLAPKVAEILTALVQALSSVQ
jgi:hypothetical protein